MLLKLLERSILQPEPPSLRVEAANLFPCFDSGRIALRECFLKHRHPLLYLRKRFQEMSVDETFSSPFAPALLNPPSEILSKHIFSHIFTQVDIMVAPKGL
jgi:hypothetical protein